MVFLSFVGVIIDSYWVYALSLIGAGIMVILMLIKYEVDKK